MKYGVMDIRRADQTACGKSNLFCHSEVAAATEESLFGLNARKERFLGAQRASE
jgi:hypothetical protein